MMMWFDPATESPGIRKYLTPDCEEIEVLELDSAAEAEPRESGVGTSGYGSEANESERDSSSDSSDLPF